MKMMITGRNIKYMDLVFYKIALKSARNPPLTQVNANEHVHIFRLEGMSLQGLAENKSELLTDATPHIVLQEAALTLATTVQ